MLAFIQTTLFLLAFAITEGSIGPRSGPLTAFLALACLAPVWLSLITGIDRHSKRDVAFVVASVLAMAIWFASNGPPRYFALATAIGFLELGRRTASHDVTTSGRTLFLSAFGLALFVVIRDHLSLWQALVAISNQASAAITNLFGEVFRLGPSYSGLLVLVGFLMVFAARSLAVHRFNWRGGTLAIVLLFVLAGVALILRAYVPGHIHGFTPRVALGWRVVQFVLFLLPLALFLSTHRLGRSTPERHLPGVGRRNLVWAGAALLLIGIGVLTWSVRIAPRTGRVLLDTRGSFNLEPLEWGKYGAQVPGGASLAMLPPLLEARGFDFATCDTIVDAQRLQDCDVFVTMNPTQSYTPEEHTAIWEFVEAGGGLLVLGDHTNIMESMGPVNELIAPTGIRLRFDSAIPLVDRWTWYGCTWTYPHPLMRAIRDESDLKISVGASLYVPTTAVPLIIGRDAFSDAGDWENANGAYLGSMAYERGEEQGDLCLAAEAPYGRGKVLVFGDTSPFQRVAVFNTHEFVTRVMTYLSGDKHAVAPYRARVVGTALALAGSVALVALFPSALAALTISSALATVWLLALGKVAVVQLPSTPLRGDIAWVDFAHGNRLDQHTGLDHGVYGISNHLTRHGYIPLRATRFDAAALESARMFVTIAPAFEFNRNERRALRGFVESGGLLVVGVGFEESHGAESLLAEFDYSIGRTPIGSAHAARVLIDSVNVFLHESWPVLRPEGRGEVWVECWGYPLVVFEKIGNGGLLVIGDSKFLCDVGLEGPESFVGPNINFLRTAIETAQARTGSVLP